MNLGTIRINPGRDDTARHKIPSLIKQAGNISIQDMSIQLLTLLLNIPGLNRPGRFQLNPTRNRTGLDSTKTPAKWREDFRTAHHLTRRDDTGQAITIHPPSGGKISTHYMSTHDATRQNYTCPSSFEI